MGNKVIKKYLTELLSKDKREDGRTLDSYRDIKIEVNPIIRANGSAKVTIGKTEVLVGVKLDVGEPFPDTPNQGVLISNAELLPLASPKFESGPPRPPAIELARVVDRGIRESKMIDLEKLCIKEKEKVWMVFIDIYPLNDDGNLFDASALGALIALKNAKMPKYDEKEEKVIYEELTKEYLPLTEEPVLCTFYKIGSSIFLDANKKEENEIDCRISIAVTKKNTIAAMQKGEFGTFTEKEINSLIEKAIQKSKELRKFIK